MVGVVSAMALLRERLVGLPFGIAAVEELLGTDVLQRGTIYRRREIVDALRMRFIELGGDPHTTEQQVIPPLKRALQGPLFERVRSGFYRYVGETGVEARDGHGAMAARPEDPEGDARWEAELADASTESAIMGILQTEGRSAVANRIRYLYDLAEDDEEEQPIHIDSLRHLALFLLVNARLVDPEIGTSPDGLAHAEWTLPDLSLERGGNGLIAMEFQPSGRIRFGALSAPYRPGVERLTVHGTLPAMETLEAIRMFTVGITRA